MRLRQEILYDLLPEFYRNRDFYEGEPLRAYLRVFEEPIHEMRSAIGRLYEDWFIETCEEGGVSLIGEVVGQSVNLDTLRAIPTQRGLVANAVSDRQRKGTLGALQAVLRDATGWCVIVVEADPKLAETAHLTGRRYALPRTVALDEAFAELGEAFDANSHSVDLRLDPDQLEGKYGLSVVDIFVWRTSVTRISRAEPKRLTSTGYAFSGLGMDSPLFNIPRRLEDRYAPCGPNHAPTPITRSALEAELLARENGADPATSYLSKNPVFRIEVEDHERRWTSIEANRMWVCDLSEWVEASRFPHLESVAIDPELGRFQFAMKAPKRVRVSYGAIWIPKIWDSTRKRVGSLANVSIAASHPNLRSTIEARLPTYSIELAENASFDLSDTDISLNAGDRLEIRSAPETYPNVVGDIKIRAGQGAAEVCLRGIVFRGSIELYGPVHLILEDCIVSPGIDSAIVGRSDGPRLPSLAATGSVVGAIRWAEGGEVELCGCILDAQDSLSIGGLDGKAGPRLSIQDSTALSSLEVNELILSSGVLFRKPVYTERLDQGVVRHSYIPSGARVPSTRHCVNEEGPHLRPLFTSTRFGTPGYARLDGKTPDQILRGGGREDEIGVFGLHRNRLREAEAAAAIEEFLPLGLEAQIAYES